MLDMIRVDDEDDLDFIREALQHAQLRIGLEARKHARGMIVVEQLAAEFQVQLAAELVHAFADARRLQLDVLVVVETDAARHAGPLSLARS